MQNHTTVIIGNKKSAGVAFILAFFFGPLGLLYSSVAGGIIMMIFGAIIGVISLGLGLIFVWIACVVWAIIAVNSHNSKIEDQVNAVSYQNAVAQSGNSTMKTEKRNESIADDLKKFKELLDIGAITQAEYDAQKAKLLSPAKTSEISQVVKPVPEPVIVLPESPTVEQDIRSTEMPRANSQVKDETTAFANIALPAPAKRKNPVIYIALVVVILAGAGFACFKFLYGRNSVESQPSTRYYYKLNSDAVVRSDPSENAGVLSSAAKKGMEIEVLDLSNPVWYKVKVYNTVGYIPAKQLVFSRRSSEGAPVGVSEHAGELDFLLATNGEYPSTILLKEPLNSRIRKLLGKKYDLFSENMNVESPIEMNGKDVFASGCYPHFCMTDEGAICVQLNDNNIIVGILSKGAVTVYSENNMQATDYPQRFKQWYIGSGGKIKMTGNATKREYDYVGSVVSIEQEGNAGFYYLNVKTDNGEEVSNMINGAVIMSKGSKKEIGDIKDGMRVGVIGYENASEIDIL